MAKYIPDNKTKRWVILSSTRRDRPFDQHEKQESPVCPFCAGNESKTPPELYRLGSGEKDHEGWTVRVIPNKFPITDIHEVIIHSTSHTEDMETLDPSQIERVLTAYTDRFRAHENDGQVIIFCNHGEAGGSSITHPHSQLVVVPHQIPLEKIAREPERNIINKTEFFSVFCPDFSQWPFETWIVPKAYGTTYGEITAYERKELSHHLSKILRAIKKIYEASDSPIPHRPEASFAYNYTISHTQNWFLRIIPRFTTQAGFELGSGLAVNTIDPTEAAEAIKNII